MELNELRKTAEEATQGNWMWVNDRDDERIRAGKFPYHHVTYTDDVVDENALYIATFDPPTVLALLSRLEQAEQAVARVREALTEVQTRGEKIRAKGNNGSIYQQERAARGEGYLEATRLAFRALDGDGRG